MSWATPKALRSPWPPWVIVTLSLSHHFLSCSSLAQVAGQARAVPAPRQVPGRAVVARGCWDVRLRMSASAPEVRTFPGEVKVGTAWPCHDLPSPLTVIIGHLGALILSIEGWWPGDSEVLTGLCLPDHRGEQEWAGGHTPGVEPAQWALSVLTAAVPHRRTHARSPHRWVGCATPGRGLCSHFLCLPRN